VCVIQIRWDASPSRHLDDVVLTIVRRCRAAAGKSPQTISGTRRRQVELGDVGDLRAGLLRSAGAQGAG
jgi:hypothetical protein